MEVVGVCAEAMKEGDDKGGDCRRLVMEKAPRRGNVLRMNHPTNWLPAGSPFLA